MRIDQTSWTHITCAFLYLLALPIAACTSPTSAPAHDNAVSDAGDAIPSSETWDATLEDAREIDGQAASLDMADEADVATDTHAELKMFCGKDYDPCDDDNPCTALDYCLGGDCIPGKGYACNDGLKCTYGACDGLGGCDYPIKPDRCLIDGKCYGDGEPKPGNPCRSCLTVVSNDTWSPDDTRPCDDSDPCTTEDHCLAGLCKGGAQLCDDQNICTDDFCYKDTGCTHKANSRSCEDGNLCTLGDKCVNKSCQEGSLYLDCENGNPCTIDFCDKEKGCQHNKATAQQACDDGNPCTVGDHCGEGSCVSGEPMDCDDENVCTDDYCSTGGTCKHLPNNIACEDGDECTLYDVCGDGVCHAGLASLSCDDLNPCTTDSCDPEQGCFHLPNQAQCDDGNPCTDGDHCVQGKCEPGELLVSCGDGNPCTDDFCNADGLCEHVPNALACDDGNPCSVGDHCNGGGCVPGPDNLDCNDFNVCTMDYCEPASGCVNTPVEGACSDGNMCTQGDYCVVGICVSGYEMQCFDVDNNQCTDNGCNPSVGCLTSYNSAPCDDDNQCTINDFCVEGVCAGANIEDCDDGNACTAEYCVGEGNCKHEPLDKPGCYPRIEVFSPKRGDALQGPPDKVLVTGKVSIPAGTNEILKVEVGGDLATLQEDGTFTYEMWPVHGMNVIEVSAVDEFGHQAATVRAYYFSHNYRSPYEPDELRIDDGLEVKLGQGFFDDDDPATPDDLAGIAALVFEASELPQEYKQHWGDGGGGWLLGWAWSADLTAGYGTPQFDIHLLEDQMQLQVTVPDLSAGVSAGVYGEILGIKIWFFTGGGSFSVDEFILTVPLAFDVAEGNLSVDVGAINVAMEGYEVGLELVFLYFFKHNFPLLTFILNVLESYFESWMAGKLDAYVDGFTETLQGIAISEQDLYIKLDKPDDPNDKSYLPDELYGEFYVGKLKAGFSSVQVSPGRFVLGLAPAILDTPGPTNVPADYPGIIVRSGCLGAEDEDDFEFPVLGEIDFAVRDDFLNEVLFLAWWSGLLSIGLDSDDLAGIRTDAVEALLDEFAPGNSDEKTINACLEALQLEASLEFPGPPVLVGCPGKDPLRLQIADVTATLSAGWLPDQLPDGTACPLKLPEGTGTLKFYESLEAQMEPILLDKDGTPTLGLTLLAKPTFWVDYELKELSGCFTLLEGLLAFGMQHVIQVIAVQQLPSGVLGSVPFPTIPLDKFGMPGLIPSGTELKFVPQTVERELGRTFMAGVLTQ